MEQIKYVDEPACKIVAEPKGHYVDYKVYSSDGEYDDGQKVYETDPIVQGEVKWDGCSNWNFGDCMMHGCTRQELLNIGIMMSICWDWTAELIPDSWSH
jgi:hypothetical protein